jgi:MSHA biogenesis protein MshG
MADFKYRARNSDGAAVDGQVEAMDRNAAADSLLKRGLFPITIDEVIEVNSNSIDMSSLNALLARSVNSDDLIVFSRQMYSLSKAGIPILRAINGLAESTRSVRFRQILEDIVEQLEQGRPLSAAFNMHRKVFSDLVISIVNVGENTGRLDESFLQLAEYFEREQQTRQQIKSAVRYPMFVIIFIVAALFILNIYVIPQFANMFSKFGVELPALTKGLLATSSFFVAYWHFLLIFIGSGIVAWIKYTNTDKGRLFWDKKKLNIPIIGSILERSTLARYSRSFSLMMRSGVPITTALSLVAGAVDNFYMAQKILEMRRNVERGESLLRSSTSSGLFTPLVLQMVAVGEETGNIDELLHNVAEYYEREVDYDLKSLTANIEPILISFVAVLVLVLALGIFTPMWDMYSVVQK